MSLAEERRQQRQRLRSSCDSCHSAKVKCASGGPLQICERCTSHGIPCSYSPSLRLTKQNAAKLASTSSPPAQSRRTSTSTPIGALPGHIHGGRSRTSSRPSYSDLTHPGLVDGFSMDGMSTPSTTSPTFGINIQSQDYVTPLWPDHNSSSQDVMSHMGPIDNSMFWSGDAVDRIFTKSGFTPAPMKKQALALDAHQGNIDAADVTSTNNVQSPDRMSQSSTSTTLSQTSVCKCHAEVLQALHLSQHLGAGVRKSGDLHIAFDILLAENKSAINRCSEMLSCKPCFSGSTSLLLVAALLSQTLTLYQLACEIHLAKSPADLGGQKSGSIVPGPLRINFGAYKLEEEDEALLKKELMLIELRKVETLLSRLKDVIDELEDQTENATYDALMTSLTRNLRQVVVQFGR